MSQGRDGIQLCAGDLRLLGVARPSQYITNPQPPAHLNTTEFQLSGLDVQYFN